MDNPCSPIDACTSHALWLKDPELRYIRKDSSVLKTVVDTISQDMCSWTIYDFNEMYSKPTCNPVFGALYTDINEKYMLLDQSIAALDALLLYQFGNDENEVRAFLTDVYNVLERKYSKKNTILIHSAPSGGKNFFVDCIMSYYINRGFLHAVANKTNHFAFQDAYGKRVVLWNEPNYEPCLVDFLKTFLGGDDSTVAVKNKGDACVFKTPVFILTNKNINIMGDPAFRDRISVYIWNHAPFLKDYNLKPNPLCTFKLFEKYNIVVQ